MESVAIFTKGEKEKQWNGGGGGKSDFPVWYFNWTKYTIVETGSF